MVTFKLQKDTIKQLKKFIGGWDTTNELLYLHTDCYNNLYLVLFDYGHIYISYLKLGNTDEFKGTYQLDKFTTTGENDPKTFKKFISKQTTIELHTCRNGIKIYEWIENKNNKEKICWTGNNDVTSLYKDPCDLNLNLDYFLTGTKTFHLKKQDFKVLELYKNHYTCIYFKKGKIEFKIYDKDYNVFAKHIICDNYNNQIEEHYHTTNKLFLQLLRKFNSKEPITIKFDDREPLVIKSEDYIGIIAPRILIEDGYGSVDGLYDNLSGD